MSLADSIKILPWCISTVVPLFYVSGTMATAVQQDEDVPAASKPEGSLAPGPSSTQVHQPRTPPLLVPPLLDIPLVGNPSVGHPFAEFLTISTQKKWDQSPSGLLNHHHNKRTHIDSQEVEARCEHSSAQDNEDMPKLIPGTGTSFKQWGQEPVSPPSSPTRATIDLEDGTVAQSSEYQGSSLLGLRVIKGECGWLWHGHSLWRLHIMFRHRWGVCTNCTGRGYGPPVDWAKAQLKRISHIHQDVWRHDHKSIRTEQDHALAEECNSF